MSYVSISGMIETVRLKSTVSTVTFRDRYLGKTDSCDRALSRAGVSNLRYLQLILKTGSIFVSMLYTTNIETLRFNYLVSTVTFDFFDRD